MEARVLVNILVLEFEFEFEFEFGSCDSGWNSKCLIIPSTRGKHSFMSTASPPHVRFSRLLHPTINSLRPGCSIRKEKESAPACRFPILQSLKHGTRLALLSCQTNSPFYSLDLERETLSRVLDRGSEKLAQRLDVPRLRGCRNRLAGSRDQQSGFLAGETCSFLRFGENFAGGREI